MLTHYPSLARNTLHQMPMMPLFIRCAVTVYPVYTIPAYSITKHAHPQKLLAFSNQEVGSKLHHDFGVSDEEVQKLSRFDRCVKD